MTLGKRRAMTLASKQPSSSTVTGNAIIALDLNNDGWMVPGVEIVPV